MSKTQENAIVGNEMLWLRCNLGYHRPMVVVAFMVEKPEGRGEEDPLYLVLIVALFQRLQLVGWLVGLSQA